MTATPLTLTDNDREHARMRYRDAMHFALGVQLTAPKGNVKTDAVLDFAAWYQAFVLTFLHGQMGYMPGPYAMWPAYAEGAGIKW